MGIEIPGYLRWVSDKVLGTDWPDADETAMQRCADYWDSAASSVSHLNDLGDDTVRQLLDSIEGDVNDAIADMWRQIGGDAGAMRELMQACDELAGMIDGAAQDVRRAKLAIIANLATPAASLVAAAATVWAFGAGAAAGAAATFAARTSIQMIIRQLIQQMLQRFAMASLGQLSRAIGKNIAVSALTGAGIEGGIEGGLQVWEKREGLRDDYDYGDIAQASGHGAVKGGVQGAFKIGVRGELPQDVGLFTTDKAKQIASDQVKPDHIAGGMLGKDIADATVGKPDGSVGERLKDVSEASSLDIPPDTFTGPPSRSESPNHD
ncbi:hypothetical protein [Rhodococcus sp. HNM0569]|uniref:WXG100-like domain-containing protein n=1 Tax=Rhodococcus sp. HNM0569 TaxID=2716340 RepID=UPI00146CC3B7|nr:hypothetical protein [Rhodococcus sp. HNM0569]NLU82100.1 hypothetical protein [Rhodococcus sp. HNM0569]